MSGGSTGARTSQVRETSLVSYSPSRCSTTALCRPSDRPLRVAVLPGAQGVEGWSSISQRNVTNSLLSPENASVALVAAVGSAGAVVILGATVARIANE